MKVLTPVLANTPASMVVDSMHSTCVKLRANQIPKRNQSQLAKRLSDPRDGSVLVSASAAHRSVVVDVPSQMTADSGVVEPAAVHKFSASSMFPSSGPVGMLIFLSLLLSCFLKPSPVVGFINW